MDVDTNKLWRDFYLAEQTLYEFFETQNTLHCLEGCEPVYRVRESSLFGSDIGANRGVQAPPAYVRCTIALKDQESIQTFHTLNQATIAAHEAACAASTEFTTTRPPARFPQFLTSVEQVNLSVNEAVQSIALEVGGSFSAVKMRTDSKSPVFDDEIESLKKLGIEAEEDIYGWTHHLYIDCDSLFEYVGSDEIQHRLITGSRYLARVRRSIREPGQPKSVRLKYGLLVLDNPCPIYDSLPRADRDDRLALIGEKVELPIEIDGELWIRNA